MEKRLNTESSHEFEIALDFLLVRLWEMIFMFVKSKLQ